MSDPNSIDVIVGRWLNLGSPVTITLTSDELHAMRWAIGDLQDQSELPKIDPMSLHIALLHLHGVTDVSSLRRDDSNVLMRFAYTWSLAPQLKMPRLQNALIDKMTDIYEHASNSFLSADYFSVNRAPMKAFQILEDTVGPGSVAEHFLTWFLGLLSTAPGELYRRMEASGIPDRIKHAIVMASHSNRPDPIARHDPLFKVDTLVNERYEWPLLPPLVLTPITRGRDPTVLTMQTQSVRCAPSDAASYSIDMWLSESSNSLPPDTDPTFGSNTSQPLFSEHGRTPPPTRSNLHTSSPSFIAAGRSYFPYGRPNEFSPNPRMRRARDSNTSSELHMSDAFLEERYGLLAHLTNDTCRSDTSSMLNNTSSGSDTSPTIYNGTSTSDEFGGIPFGSPIYGTATSLYSDALPSSSHAEDRGYPRNQRLRLTPSAPRRSYPSSYPEPDTRDSGYRGSSGHRERFSTEIPSSTRTPSSSGSDFSDNRYNHLRDTLDCAHCPPRFSHTISSHRSDAFEPYPDDEDVYASQSYSQNQSSFWDNLHRRRDFRVRPRTPRRGRRRW